jgi:hypothetical protein
MAPAAAGMDILALIAEVGTIVQDMAIAVKAMRIVVLDASQDLDVVVWRYPFKPGSSLFPSSRP